MGKDFCILASDDVIPAAKMVSRAVLNSDYEIVPVAVAHLS